MSSSIFSSSGPGRFFFLVLGAFALTGLVQLALTGWVVAQGDITSYTEAPHYLAKRAYYTEHASEYSMVLFGSSRVYRHLDPRVISTCTGEKVYNFGVGNFITPRLTNAVMSLLERGLLDNRTILVEVADWQYVDYQVTHPTLFSITFQDAWQYLFNNPEKDILRKIKFAQAFLRNRLAMLLNLPSIYFRRDPNPSTTMLPEEVSRFHGYYPNDLELRERRQWNAARDQYLERLQHRYSQYLANPVADQVRTPPIRAFRGGIDEYRRLDALARAHSVRVFYFISPRIRPVIYENLARIYDFDASMQQRTLDFASALEFPEFTEPTLGFDRGHLNGRGAKRLSEHVCAALAPRLRQQTSSTPAGSRRPNRNSVAKPVPGGAGKVSLVYRRRPHASLHGTAFMRVPACLPGARDERCASL